MEKINVLFLAEELRVGGAESYFYTIENNVDREKFNWFSMAVKSDGYSKLIHPELFSDYSFSQNDRYKKALDVCIKEDISVIHVNSLRLAFVAAKIKKKRNVKIIYTKHNITILEKISKSVYACFLNKNIDIVNVICDSERVYLESIGVKKEIIKVIFNGVKIENFPFAYKKSESYETNINIGILARLSPEKNHRLFLEICKQLHALDSRTNFFIGGDGPCKEEIESLIISNQMSDYVKLCGYVKAEEFYTFLDYSMLVSEREVFPMSIIEAMASGMIVVAKDIGGIKELINEKTGYLIKGDNPSDYVNALLESINSNQDTEFEKRIRARSRVENEFTLDIMLDNICRLYTM